MAKKPNKAERCNAFLLGTTDKSASGRAALWARSWLATHALVPASASDEQLAFVMDAVLEALQRAYMRGVGDAFDVVNGSELEVVS